MDTAKLRRFAQHARRSLSEQVGAKLALVLDPDSAARRESPGAVAALVQQLDGSSQAQIIDKVAYTWFNRFCALRFMDVNGYSRSRVVSPADESQFQPEILADAKMGHIDAERVPGKTRLQVAALLSGSATSRDPQQEAYRLLVVAECNSFHKAMPYLFERIADYTELLMPDDLLSGNSILSYTREAMTPDACQDVEVIGWLYQFYISEKKDQVFEGLKKGRKISAADIPAATQLFTPHWIVRYLVENSLGRLWMLNHPGSGLIGQMDYYIKPAQAETDFLRIQRPEDIKVCDPACGSGHMLTYAFDLLYAIYEEAGTDASEIPTKILTHNLYGIELDERAGDLAAFALTMKARAKQRRFFDKAVEPNICVLEKVEFDPGELGDYMTAVGRDLFTMDLRETLQQFDEADNFGSLIRPKLGAVNDVLPLLAGKDFGGQLFLTATHDKVLKALHQADYLSQKYQVVVANPPYMGSKGMNASLGAFAKLNYPDSKADLFSMFIERNLDLAVTQGAVSMITMQSWMFLSSFESLRRLVISKTFIASLVQIGHNSFPELNSKIAQACAFVIETHGGGSLGSYINLNDASQSADKQVIFLNCIQGGKIYWKNQLVFEKIPGGPVAYWAGPCVISAFSLSSNVASVSSLHRGISTGDNDRFSRLWHEVAMNRTCFTADSRVKAITSSARWFPYSRGGSFRKWYGLGIDVIDYEADGFRMLEAAEAGETPGFRHDGSSEYFKATLTWSALTSGLPSFRFLQDGFVLGHKGASIKTIEGSRLGLLGLLNSNSIEHLLSFLSPTLDITISQIQSLPIPDAESYAAIQEAVKMAVDLSRIDWDSQETSWDFSVLCLLRGRLDCHSIANTCCRLGVIWRDMADKMRSLEVDNNRLFIEAYGLGDELKPDVQISEITLVCNPYYRYGSGRSEPELESLQLADTMREFISYAVGCMFGRYSLDKPGLILANAGDTLAEYLQQVPKPSFTPDADNVIPMLDSDWFTDDATERCRSFLRVTFGEEKYEENLRFIEDALGKDLRKYMVKDFYNDHVKRYKKRPIYWLFASPKGTFSALVYLHRYRPDTVSVVLKYLREFKEKLAARRAYLDQVSLNPSAGQGEKTKALKENDLLKKQLLELDDYERDVLFPLASQQIALDLDDGVKVNYLKLGPALKKITGLDAKEED